MQKGVSLFLTNKLLETLDAEGKWALDQALIAHVCQAVVEGREPAAPRAAELLQQAARLVGYAIAGEALYEVWPPTDLYEEYLQEGAWLFPAKGEPETWEDRALAHGVGALLLQHRWGAGSTHVGRYRENVKKQDNNVLITIPLPFYGSLPPWLWVEVGDKKTVEAAGRVLYAYLLHQETKVAAPAWLCSEATRPAFLPNMKGIRRLDALL
jgi:hypothetical protein